ncbi:MAG: multifunctional CCA tRNA nucleotidyl transferase/2'3'-cyclic phosphodiesterase/2'nucleotidase/phosphatase [Burkholderiales bacterium]|nr:multifunctional CCA tRNA nucleotidyl transferase/2'3'-cyclic phosphodiesterase/2'nucleotidase/phosphatase [Burkholderiales bacterium]
MKIYRVGGAVRDERLGLPVRDRDWVVVGATPEAMVQAGFRPVGRDFPVFLHPQTHEEYALARTERKSGPGYRGFVVHAAPDVTLEDDLARRDLTINAMALDEHGSLVDPFGGAQDLSAGVLRHVSPAFTEDPVRILRVARFAARFGFTVAPETLQLMRQMVADGEVDHLVAERVWQEVSRGLMEARPSTMFRVLQDCDALPVIAPELAVMLVADGSRILDRLDRAADDAAPLTVRFALTVWRTGDDLESLCARWRVPADCRELAELAARWLSRIGNAPASTATQLVELLQGVDAFRRPDRFRELICVARHDSDATPPYAPAERLERALTAAASVDAARLAADRSDPRPIPERIRAAREAAVDAILR